MDADALETSHSISVEVENPTQISEIFDSISYTKGRFPIYFEKTNIDKVLKRIGAAVIRMMNDFLGESTFRKGVTNYLGQKCFKIPNYARDYINNKFEIQIFRKYGNAQQDELWQFLTEQAHADSILPLNVDVKTICDTWTLQKGFPLVTFTRNYNNGSVFISQVTCNFLR